MKYTYLKPELKNLSQGERIAFVRQLRLMTQDEVFDKLVSRLNELDFDIYYINLIWVYVCYFLYIRNLVRMRKSFTKVFRVTIIGTAIFASLWIVLTPVTKLGFYIDEKVRDLNNTTPDILSLYEIIEECKESGVKVIVMEVSSHSLELDRVYGFKFDYVVFTNLTKDHLNFHDNMNNYLNAKKKLFSMVKDNGIGLINIDDTSSKYFKCKNIYSYGFGDCDFNIYKYKLILDKVIYKFKYRNKSYKVKINIPGKYNIYNSIIGIIILNNMGISMRKIIKLLNKVTLPSGRMEIININKSYAIVDYAHTPDAVSNVLKNVNEFKKGKVYTIIGCGGNRDKTKRKDMGIISTELSDYVIFTNDNPRSENPDDIILDMTKDLISSNYEIIKDRREAIRKGVSMLNKNDILLVLGKGHENYQIINGIKYHFNDKEEVSKCIKT
mgnify:CR=1 FL=1